MLPSDKPNPSLFFHNPLGSPKVLSTGQGIVYHKECVESGLSLPQHLYFTSDEEIKDNDWCLRTKQNTIHISDGDKFEDSKKLIASTDYHLSLILNCKIGDDFILAYIKAYNEGKPITEVNLEYETDIQTEPSTHEGNPCSHVTDILNILKLRSNGTCIIHPIKEKMYTLEEAFELFYEHYDEYLTYVMDNDLSTMKGQQKYYSFKKWFDKNYPLNQ